MRERLARWSMRLAAWWWSLALRLRGDTPRMEIERRFEAAVVETLGDTPLRATDVVVDAPDGYVQVEPRGVTGTPLGGALLLVEPGGDRYLPIFVGGMEAYAVQARLERKPFPRPLPYDLLEHLLLAVRAEITGVRIDRLVDDVFTATVVFELDDERVLELDARASDAVVLALGRSAPMVVSRAVMAAASRPLTDAPA